MPTDTNTERDSNSGVRTPLSAAADVGNSARTTFGRDARDQRGKHGKFLAVNTYSPEPLEYPVTRTHAGWARKIPKI